MSWLCTAGWPNKAWKILAGNYWPWFSRKGSCRKIYIIHLNIFILPLSLARSWKFLQYTVVSITLSHVGLFHVRGIKWWMLQMRGTEYSNTVWPDAYQQMKKVQMRSSTRNERRQKWSFCFLLFDEMQCKHLHFKSSTTIIYNISMSINIVRFLSTQITMYVCWTYQISTSTVCTYPTPPFVVISLLTLTWSSDALYCETWSELFNLQRVSYSTVCNDTWSRDFTWMLTLPKHNSDTHDLVPNTKSWVRNNSPCLRLCSHHLWKNITTL